MDGTVFFSSSCSGALALPNFLTTIPFRDSDKIGATLRNLLVIEVTESANVLWIWDECFQPR
eukprot:m.3009 g.3009  ORF g.3009 m.3009 type:complete len:62 (-) comp3389_c0_seq1:33-218(-)